MITLKEKLYNKILKLSRNKLIFSETSIKNTTKSNSSKNNETDNYNSNNINQPTGGFPPIYIVNNDILSEQKFNISSDIKDININDLLKKKKDESDKFI